MEKQDFLDKLRQALSGKIAGDLVTENLRFYEDYINTEVRKGKSEEEVLAVLGDPRLIARTIVETAGGRQSAEYAGSQYDRSSQTDSGTEFREYESGGGVRKVNFFRVPSWVWLVLVILVVVLVLSAIFSVITAILPVLLPILTVLLLVKVFRDWIN